MSITRCQWEGAVRILVDLTGRRDYTIEEEEEEEAARCGMRPRAGEESRFTRGRERADKPVSIPRIGGPVAGSSPRNGRLAPGEPPWSIVALALLIPVLCAFCLRQSESRPLGRSLRALDRFWKPEAPAKGTGSESLPSGKIPARMRPADRRSRHTLLPQNQPYDWVTFRDTEPLFWPILETTRMPSVTLCRYVLSWEIQR